MPSYALRTIGFAAYHFFDFSHINRLVIENLNHFKAREHLHSTTDNIDIRSRDSRQHFFAIRDCVAKSQTPAMVYALAKQLQVEEYVVLSVLHILDDFYIVSLEKVFFEFQPIEFFLRHNSTPKTEGHHRHRLPLPIEASFCFSWEARPNLHLASMKGTLSHYISLPLLCVYSRHRLPKCDFQCFR